MKHRTKVFEEFEGGRPLTRILYGEPVEKYNKRAPQESVTQVVSEFEAGQVFIIERIEREGGTIADRALFVMRAGEPGDVMQRVRNVQPGAHVLLQAAGKRQTNKVLKWLGDLVRHESPLQLPDEVFHLTQMCLVGQFEIEPKVKVLRGGKEA